MASSLLFLQPSASDLLSDWLRLPFPFHPDTLEATGPESAGS